LTKAARVSRTFAASPETPESVCAARRSDDEPHVEGKLGRQEELQHRLPVGDELPAAVLAERGAEERREDRILRRRERLQEPVEGPRFLL
jgi:hypothetical protein